MVEMSEAAHILRSSTQNSLVILDEVGRGTSTQDGLAIASSILEDIAIRTKSWAMFATHYHELVPLSAEFKSVRTVQTEVKEEGTGITFTHKLIDGASGSSFGVEVAKIAGLPEHVIENAAGYLKKGEQSKNTSDIRKGASAGPNKKIIQPKETITFKSGLKSDINEEPSSNSEVLTELERLNINRLTPLQALNLINKWQGRIAEPLQTRQVGLFETLDP